MQDGDRGAWTGGDTQWQNAVRRRAGATRKHKFTVRLPFQAPLQPRRAEYLPPDWSVVKERDGSRTYLGPDGQRLGYAEGCAVSGRNCTG